MIFVTGAPRSGTSMTCQVLDSLGLSFGHGLAGPTHHNRRGFYEHLGMRKLLKKWAGEVGSDPLGQWPLLDRGWQPTPEQVSAFSSEARSVLGTVKAVKDPKILPLWPLVTAAFPESRWVLVRRDVHQIARSAFRTSFMIRMDSVPKWTLWAHEMDCRVLMLAESLSTRAVEVRPDPSKPEAFRSAATFLGLGWDPDRVASVLDPSLWSTNGKR